MPPLNVALTRLGRAAVLALVLLVGLGAAPAGAQVPTTTTPGVLVPGDTTPAPATTAPTTSTSAPAEEGGGLLDLDANEKVWVIVGGLVVVALLVLVLTVLYWRHTRPDVSRAQRRADKADEKADRKAARRQEREEPGGADEEPATGPADGPMDLDGVLGTPEPSRSVFGDPEPPEGPPR